MSTAVMLISCLRMCAAIACPIFPKTDYADSFHAWRLRLQLTGKKINSRESASVAENKKADITNISVNSIYPNNKVVSSIFLSRNHWCSNIQLKGSITLSYPHPSSEYKGAGIILLSHDFSETGNERPAHSAL
jgi:hypothetical protein